MTPILLTYLVATLCVLGLAGGQVLFKLGAGAITAHGLFSQQALLPLAAAVTLYGIITLGWVWTLQRIALGRVYPLMALAFIVVPLASHLALGERFSLQYFLGVGLIVAGILVIVRA